MATWEEHWQTGHTPWDAGKAVPTLEDFAPKWARSVESVREKKALVPGCGAGYDVFCLAKAGLRAVGLDIAPSVTTRFNEVRSQEGLMEEQAQLIIADFFQASPEELGAPYDLIWDYTFYCAIDREMRPAWKKRMLELLAPDGTLATLLFPVDPTRDPTEGPPFALDPDEVQRTFSPELTRVSLQEATESHPERSGKEFLAVWKRSNA